MTRPPGSLAELRLARLRQLRELQAVTIGAARAAAPPTPGALAALVTRSRELQPPHLRLIDDAFTRLDAGEWHRVAVFLPPRHGKSRRVVRWGVPWWLQHHPDHRVAVASYGAMLAEDHGRWIRDLISTYNGLRGGPLDLGLRLSPASTSAGRFDLDGAAGGFVAVGVGSALTGRGADLLIVDDPVKDAEAADSPLQRQRTWDWWQAVAQTRLEPGGRAVLVSTRWHEDDLAGRILADEPEGWHIINLPLLAEAPDPRRWWAAGPDPLGRTPGEPLWPERYGLDWAADTRPRLGERVWASLYQQRPAPVAGGLWKWDTIRAHRVLPDQVPELTGAVVALDPAASAGTSSDETGIVTAGIAADRQLYVLADDSGRWEPAEWARRALLAAQAHGAGTVVYESNQGGNMIRLALDVAWDALVRDEAVSGLAPRVVGVHAHAGKSLRAEPVSALYTQGRVHHAGPLPELEDQLTRWVPGMDSPDRLDALVYAVTHLAGATPKPSSVSSVAGYRIA
jgi:hypothetical protein